MKGWNWALIYRASVVALLALILAQLSGVLDLRTLPHDLRRLARDISNIGQPKEEPAPWVPASAGSEPARSGIERLYADDIEKAYERAFRDSQRKP